MNFIENNFPDFSGSTGGWLKAAEIEEKYVISWINPSRNVLNIFENPTGGLFFMKTGKNVGYFAKKEQCLALSRQLRLVFKIVNYYIFRVLPNREFEVLHPNDNVPPEKVNKGRICVGKSEFAFGKKFCYNKYK
jgi:photosystem I subunit 2